MTKREFLQRARKILKLDSLPVKIAVVPFFLSLAFFCSLVINKQFFPMAEIFLQVPASYPTPPPSPTPIGNPVNWQTPTVSLQTEDFYIIADKEKYLANTGNVDVRSDPGNSEYTTLELNWWEKGKEMRFFIYFRADGTWWWPYEMRTYNGQVPGDWIMYTAPEMFPKSYIGQPLMVANDVTFKADLNNPYDGSIYFKELHLQAFKNQTPVSPAPPSPSPIPTVIPSPIPPSPLPLPTPTPTCVPEGGSVPVVPGAAECCPGLAKIGCQRPRDDGSCTDCVGAAICTRCGNGNCGLGENYCNCPQDCQPKISINLYFEKFRESYLSSEKFSLFGYPAGQAPRNLEFFLAGRITGNPTTLSVTEEEVPPVCKAVNGCNILLKTERHLAYVIEARDVSWQAPTGVGLNVRQPLTIGDLYPEYQERKLGGDDIINTADLFYLLRQWGWSGKADLNNDGRVNFIDIRILLANRDKKGPIYSPPSWPFPWRKR